MIYLFLYKVFCLFSGLAIIFLGYHLFIKGIFAHSGDLDASWKDYKLILKKAAPGTYFVIFGSIILITVVFQGLAFDEVKKSNPGHVAPTIPSFGNETSSSLHPGDSSKQVDSTDQTIIHEKDIPATIDFN